MTIQFVRADDGQISGRLDPYWDPDRRCRASAWFLGSVHGDIMRGTFSSVCEDRGWPSNGRWKVTRKRGTADK
jgi:hypothetical protein